MATIKDVAKASGVSAGTVSNVINNGAMVHPETRENVLRAMRLLNYYPSAVARALSRKRMNTLGIVLRPGELSPYDSPFFGVLFHGILRAASARRQNVTLYVGESWVNAEKSLLHFCDGRSDGLFHLGQPLEGSDILTALLDSHVPLVCVSDPGDDDRLTWVDVDNTDAAYHMTQYLISLGHRRIAFLSDTPRLHFVSARLEGYRQALRDAGINPNDRWVSYVGHRSEEVTAALEPMARSTAIDRPTAWFCNGDSIAGTALRVCERSGIRVPQDLSITGFNDDNGAKDSHPPLTTIRQPYDRIGEAAVELLLARIDDPTGVGQHFVLPTELIVRGSSGPPP